MILTEKIETLYLALQDQIYLAKPHLVPKGYCQGKNATLTLLLSILLF